MLTKIVDSTAEKTKRSEGRKCAPLAQAQAWGVSSRPAPCNIDYDSIIDVIQAYPQFKEYFAEKLAGVKRMQDRIDNPALRFKEENLKFLLCWRDHYQGQIQLSLNYLLPKKDKQNG